MVIKMQLIIAKRNLINSLAFRTILGSVSALGIQAISQDVPIRHNMADNIILYRRAHHSETQMFVVVHIFAAGTLTNLQAKIH